MLRMTAAKYSSITARLCLQEAANKKRVLVIMKQNPVSYEEPFFCWTTYDVLGFRQRDACRCCQSCINVGLVKCNTQQIQRAKVVCIYRDERRTTFFSSTTYSLLVYYFRENLSGFCFHQQQRLHIFTPGPATVVVHQPSFRSRLIIRIIVTLLLQQ